MCVCVRDPLQVVILVAMVVCLALVQSRELYTHDCWKWARGIPQPFLLVGNSPPLNLIEGSFPDGCF